MTTLENRPLLPRRRGLLAGAVAVTLFGLGTAPVSADTPSGSGLIQASPVPAAQAPPLTLVTGQKITVLPNKAGPSSYLLQPARIGDNGVISWQLGGNADHYVVPVDALPYLGKGLDPSLFDVTALARDGLAGQGRTPVTLSFPAGTVPAPLPGVALTSVSGSTAQGYVTPQSAGAFADALRHAIGQDVAAGRKPGTTPFFGGLTMTATGADVAGSVTPNYSMHIVQITATDALGTPADTDAFVMNNDSLAREAVNVPVNDGLARVAVPAGDYTVASAFPRWDDQGDLIDLRQVTAMDVTVPSTGSATAVGLDARTATSIVSLTTPRPSVREVAGLDTERIDATGQAAVAFGLETWSGATIAVEPESGATVGKLQYRARFDSVATVPSDNYRYDLAFSADHIDADQSYSVDPTQLATVHHNFSVDPAADPSASLLAGPFDSAWLAGTEEVSGYTFLTLPGHLTEYVQTYPGSSWSESLFASSAMVHGEARPFAGGKEYTVNWLHGPLAPALGVHHTDQYDPCVMCTAGSVATLAYETVGDSTPDHIGATYYGSSASAYINGELVASEDGSTGFYLSGVPTGSATYRLVLTTDSAGDPTASQSTHTVTDLTVKSPASADSGSALPLSQRCEGETDSTPCQILPALNLTYNMASDLTNTSTSPLQVMGVTVGHVSYDGQGSNAPITSLAVRVSFDGGTTWNNASVSGAGGHYAAMWTNPASAAGTAPMLQVTATDSIGGSVTQTITNAYSIAAAPAHRR